jgi:threonine dehydrogenase-like Zn-dependent dehydrogenase
VKALVFEKSFGRIAATRVLSALSARAFTGPLAPIKLRSIPDPEPPGPGWVTVRTSLAGICGSDFKQVFLNGSADNPMTAVISFPHVLGHEAVGVVHSAGPDVKHVRPGQRVVLNPWLSCEPRGLTPCRWCQEGQHAQCLNFTEGHLSDGVHIGNCESAPGGFAEYFVAHESMAVPVPESVSDELAVLADPFSVSFHAVTRNPPNPGATALVYGCGTLGLMAIAILRDYYPGTRILAIAKYEHQAEAARALGASDVLLSGGMSAASRKHAVQWIGERLEDSVRSPWFGSPWLKDGADVVYDTVSSAATIEVGVRVLRSRGRLVVIGVEPARRFEWTPLYFKEISITGSNAFGLEEFGGRTQHAFDWYFEWLAGHSGDLGKMLTHRFKLEDYGDAFMAGKRKGATGLLKAAFEF